MRLPAISEKVALHTIYLWGPPNNFQPRANVSRLTPNNWSYAVPFSDGGDIQPDATT